VRRILLTGLVVAASVAVLALVGDALGLVAVWPLVLVSGAGLMFGVPRLRHAIALLAGATAGLVSTTAAAALLPATPTGRAIGAGAALLLVTGIATASRMRLPLGLLFIGWAVMTGMLDPLVAAGTARFMADAPLTAASLLVSIGLGMLVAQVGALVGRGLAMRGRARRSEVPPSLASVAGLITLALTVALVAGSMSLSVAAHAQDAGSDVVGDVRTLEHRQVIMARGGPDGTLTRGEVVTQLTATGEGSARVTLRDQPVGGLRLVSGFRRPPREDGAVTYDLDLRDGSASVRSVADLDRALPVRVDVSYELDGIPITAGELVGSSGRVRASLMVTNLTSEPREVRAFDGQGRARVELRDVAVPMVGTLAVALDDGFSDVRSDDAMVVAGEGGRGTRVEAALVLHGPSGAPVRTVTWEADVRDGVVPPVSLRLVPIVVADTPSGRDEVAAAEALVDRMRAIADGGALLRTALTAIGLALDPDDPTGPGLSAQMVAVLDQLGTGAGEAVAVGNADLALVAAQDERRRAGDGLPYGVLADGPDVTGTLVLAIELDGLGSDTGPVLPLRLGLGVLLLGVVGLLGRPVSEALGAAPRA
jgi:hypothetical protein